MKHKNQFNQFNPFVNSALSLRFVNCMGGGGDGGGIDDTNDQKAIVDVANLTMERYENVQAPIEDKYIADTLNYDNEDRVQNLSSKAEAASNNQFSQAIDSDVNAMTSAGLNPNSGAFKTAINDRYLQAANSTADNVNKTKQALQDEGIRGKQNIVAMGYGQEAQALQGLNSLAGESVQKAKDDAFNSHNTAATNNYATGAIVGAGARAALGEDYDR